jgi:hypothetical protein
MDLLQHLSSLSGGSGAFSGAEAEALQKALTAGYGTDSATFTGATAFRIQSLDHTMKATIQENKHFKLFNAMPKSTAGATVDEWTEQDLIGGFLGGSTNSELGIINAAQGNYARRTAQVKFLMTRREVSLVSTLGNNIVQAKAVEARNGALQLLTDAEFLCFEGDSSVVPTEFDGIDVQIAGLNSSDHIIDAGGASLSQLAQVNQAVQVIVGMGNYGTPTDLFVSNGVQADFDNNMDADARVLLNQLSGSGKISKGSPVEAIRTSWGPVRSVPDVFIRDEPMLVPFQLVNPQNGALAASLASQQPASVTVSANSSVSGSNWQTAHAGQFYYFVTGVTNAGQSTGVMSAAVTVAAGGSVTITITQSSSGLETGYAIYRSRKNGTNQTNDVRLMKRMPRNMSGSTTTYTDMNFDFPGTTKARLLSMGPGADAISWRQLYPMSRFELYPTQAATLPWAQLLFGYLRLQKRRQHVLIKNIVTASQLWKPFG